MSHQIQVRVLLNEQEFHIRELLWSIENKNWNLANYDCVELVRLAAEIQKETMQIQRNMEAKS